MKILMVSDIHSDYNAAISSYHSENSKDDPLDYVLDCGDHTDIKNLFEFVPHYYINGNHEPDEILVPEDQMPLPYRISPGQTIVLPSKNHKVRVAGLDGNYTDPSKDYAVTNENIEKLERIEEGDLDILLTHESPVLARKNLQYKHMAEKVIRQIDRIKPKFVFSGHMNRFDDTLFTPGEIQNIVLEDMVKGYGVLRVGEEYRLERVRCRFG
ncbi:hypothetical protein CMI43_01350 [Candidatus Pacearchaeota archaeon]|jgi:predicted phosphodiesterase|nr:hypothetical protein [Candidatus Pacearchaeota archaeon]|tara:strand:- start:107 stop:742 length:636 start_codon:yes stop_codon:yes gene_type:complete